MRNFAIAFLSLTLATAAITGCSSDDSSSEATPGIETPDSGEMKAADGSTAKPSGSGSRE